MSHGESYLACIKWKFVKIKFVAASKVHDELIFVVIKIRKIKFISNSFITKNYWTFFRVMTRVMFASCSYICISPTSPHTMTVIVWHTGGPLTMTQWTVHWTPLMLDCYIRSHSKCLNVRWSRIHFRRRLWNGLKTNSVSVSMTKYMASPE